MTTERDELADLIGPVHIGMTTEEEVEAWLASIPPTASEREAFPRIVDAMYLRGVAGFRYSRTEHLDIGNASPVEIGTLLRVERYVDDGGRGELRAGPGWTVAIILAKTETLVVVAAIDQATGDAVYDQIAAELKGEHVPDPGAFL